MSVAPFPSVVVYTKRADPYSVRACTLLRMKGVAFVERDIAYPGVSDEMLARTGSSVPPQVVIGGKAIGGFDALGSLELKGELDALLVPAPSTSSFRGPHPQSLSTRTE